MRRDPQRRRGWRPGPDTAIAVLALFVAAGGVSWGLTRAAGPAVITACTVPANSQLVLSMTGACPSGDTFVAQWNQQGPQGAPGRVGPQGPPGVNQAIVSTLTTPFYDRFAVTTTVNSPGTYWVQGMVTLTATTYHWKVRASRFVVCELVHTGLNPPPQTTVAFVLMGRRWSPPTYHGPLQLSSVVSVPSAPAVLEFACGTIHAYGRQDTQFWNATIDAQLVKTGSLKQSNLKLTFHP
jgi:hypothetical protein